MTASIIQQDRLRAVQIWLGVIALLVIATLLVGGATRLTESGLSIVEWKPVTGVLPPLSDESWAREFAAYKTIPQYREINRGMSLSEFKTIYFWEWGHRLLGRVIGVAFLLPFLFFLWRGGLSISLRAKLWIIFALGGLQGAVGWWMVTSGLTARVSVSQYRLAVHLMLALFILSAIVWTLRRLQNRPAVVVPIREVWTARAILVLTFLQFYFGALVAGLRAGKIYNTWPEIDGDFIPAASRLFFEKPWWRNFFDNMLTVQFTHRMLAYTLLALAVAHAIDTFRTGAPRKVVVNASLLAIAMLLQAALGVATLLAQAPLDLALTHQAAALVVLMLALLHAERLGRFDPPQSISAAFSAEAAR